MKNVASMTAHTSKTLKISGQEVVAEGQKPVLLNRALDSVAESKGIDSLVLTGTFLPSQSSSDDDSSRAAPLSPEAIKEASKRNVKQFVTFIKQNETIKHLTLEFCPISVEDFAEVCLALAENTTITDLNFNDVWLSMKENGQWHLSRLSSGLATKQIQALNREILDRNKIHADADAGREVAGDPLAVLPSASADGGMVWFIGQGTSMGSSEASTHYEDITEKNKKFVNTSQASEQNVGGARESAGSSKTITVDTSKTLVLDAMWATDPDTGVRGGLALGLSKVQTDSTLDTLILQGTLSGDEVALQQLEHFIRMNEKITKWTLSLNPVYPGELAAICRAFYENKTVITELNLSGLVIADQNGQVFSTPAEAAAAVNQEIREYRSTHKDTRLVLIQADDACKYVMMYGDAVADLYLPITEKNVEKRALDQNNVPSSKTMYPEAIFAILFSAVLVMAVYEEIVDNDFIENPFLADSIGNGILLIGVFGGLVSTAMHWGVTHYPESCGNGVKKGADMLFAISAFAIFTSCVGILGAGFGFPSNDFKAAEIGTKAMFGALYGGMALSSAYVGVRELRDMKNGPKT